MGFLRSTTAAGLRIASQKELLPWQILNATVTIRTWLPMACLERERPPFLMPAKAPGFSVAWDLGTTWVSMGMTGRNMNECRRSSSTASQKRYARLQTQA